MLRVEHLHTYYGESHILQGVDLSVSAAQCVALLGRNGAGKTTTLRSILGLTPARGGHVIFNGTDITRLPTHRIVKSGIAFVPEDRGIFPTVTVEEHLAIALGASKHRPRRKPVEYVFEIFPRLAERRRSLGGQLSGGEQQMLAIGRALVAGPDLMILDAVLKDLKASGTPILLVEQNYHLATQLADYVYVISQGRVQFAGDTQLLIANEDIRRTYLSV